MKIDDAIIMIVNDNILIVGMWKRAISKKGFQPKNIHLIHDGETAIKHYLAMSKKPDLIILDDIMPGMDGFNVCKTIRELEKQNKTEPATLLFVTNLPGKDIHDKLTKEVGANDFIQISNVSPIDLANIVVDYIEKR